MRFNHTMIFFKLTQKDHSAIEMHRLKNIVIFSYFHFFLTKLFLIHSQHFRKFARFQMLLNSPPSIFTDSFLSFWYCSMLKAHSWVWDNFWQLKFLWEWWEVLFYLIVKAFFILLSMLKILSWLFDHVEKRLYKKYWEYFQNLWRYRLAKKIQ